MNHATPRARLLRSLHRLANTGVCYDVLDVADEAGLSLFVALNTVEQLHLAGLLQRRTLRLTLAGLAAAVSVAAKQQRASQPYSVPAPATGAEERDSECSAEELESYFGGIAAATA